MRWQIHFRSKRNSSFLRVQYVRWIWSLATHHHALLPQSPEVTHLMRLLARLRNVLSQRTLAVNYCYIIQVLSKDEATCC
jgi:hypothetical protein